MYSFTHSHMEQSMFTRFVRLGVPTVQLNAQGRMRPSLATLWNWRYKNLGNLPAVLPASPEPRFALANKGLAHEVGSQMLVRADGFGQCGVAHGCGVHDASVRSSNSSMCPTSMAGVNHARPPISTRTWVRLSM